MAVTQNSDGASEQQVDNGIERERAVVSPLHRDFSGTLTRNQDKKSLGRLKSYINLMSKKRKKVDQDSLSDIEDFEVAEYLHTKEEHNIKTFLWEAMNKKYSEAKKQKRINETKKRAPVKKAAKTTENIEIKKTSSKINYDALKLLEDEFGEF